LIISDDNELQLIRSSSAPFQSLASELDVNVGQTLDKQELLNDILASYSSSGLPVPDIIDDDDDETALLFTLENNWTDVVRDHELLDKRQRDCQEAVWELLNTELEHISKLRVVVHVRTSHLQSDYSL